MYPARMSYANVVGNRWKYSRIVQGPGISTIAISNATNLQRVVPAIPSSRRSIIEHQRRRERQPRARRFLRLYLNDHRLPVATSKCTFAKVHLPVRPMPAILLHGKIVRAQVLPRQRAHEDPPESREGAARYLSVHVVGSHIIAASTLTWSISFDVRVNPFKSVHTLRIPSVDKPTYIRIRAFGDA